MFNAFSSLAGGLLWEASFAPAPVKTDAGLNYTRQAHEYAPLPYPQSIGAVNGLLHLFDQAEYATMLGKTPTGPYMGALPYFPAVFPDMQGALAKVTG